jgi:hypothetical protein
MKVGMHGPCKERERERECVCLCVIAHVDKGWEPTTATYRSRRVAGTGTVPPKFGQENVCLEVCTRKATGARVV